MSSCCRKSVCSNLNDKAQNTEQVTFFLIFLFERTKKERSKNIFQFHIFKRRIPSLNTVFRFTASVVNWFFLSTDFNCI